MIKHLFKNKNEKEKEGDSESKKIEEANRQLMGDPISSKNLSGSAGNNKSLGDCSIAGVNCNNGKIAGVGRNYIDKGRNNKEKIEYCPTNIKMIADYMTKPLKGSSHYHKFRQIVMGSG